MHYILRVIDFKVFINEKIFITVVLMCDVISQGNNQKVSKEYDIKKKEKERKRTIEFKKRRRKKEQQSNYQKTCEVKEGKSYDTVVDMNSNICSDNICDIPPPQTEQT